MAVRFPEATEPLDLAGTRIDYCYEHLTIVEQGHALGELWRPAGIAIDTDTNQIYIVDGSDNYSRVSIFLETGEFLTAFTHGLMKCPYGIAFHRNNVYVTDLRVHFVFHFKVGADIRFVTMLGGLGSDIGKFNNPNQLAISINGDVFVTDRNNHRIQILDSDLHYQRQISHHSMTRPCDVKLMQDELYVLSRTNSPCFHVFSYAGDKIRSLISCGNGMQVTDPSFFCLDAREKLVINDFGTHRVKIFSKEGVLLHSLGEKVCEVGMYSGLYGIALIDSFKLVIASCNIKYGLQIFS